MEKINLTSRKNLFKKFVGVDELRFELPERNTSMTRFVITKHDAAAIIIYNKSQHTTVLIRQFRAPVFTREQNGFIYEIPAGVLEPGENAENCIIREGLEETGYRISNPRLLSVFYPSCGFLNEKISLFFAEVKDQDKIENGGGLDAEHEYLDVVEIPVQEAFQMLADGEITDAKTMLGIFYLKDLIQK